MGKASPPVANPKRLAWGFSAKDGWYKDLDPFEGKTGDHAALMEGAGFEEALLLADEVATAGVTIFEHRDGKGFAVALQVGQRGSRTIWCDELPDLLALLREILPVVEALGRMAGDDPVAAKHRRSRSGW